VGSHRFGSVEDDSETFFTEGAKRRLSHPELPAALKEEGRYIAAEAFSALRAPQKDDPAL
jgi:hypothetical protein